MMLRFVAFAAALLAPAAAYAHTPEEAMRLGEKFMAREEWYRAATAFQEAALEATGPAAQDAWLRAADAHRMARQYESAASLYREAASAATEKADLAAVREGQALYFAKKFDAAAARLTSFAAQYPESAYRDEGEAYFALAKLAVADWDTAAKSYRGIADRATDATAKQAWAELADSTGKIGVAPEKSLRVAALLSALVPGLGQVYTGHYGEAGMSLVANAIFGLLFWDSWLKARDLAERPHRGWAYTTPAIFGFLGSSFYLGNIYGAALSAQRHNRLEVDKNRDRVKDRTVRLTLIEVPLN